MMTAARAHLAVALPTYPASSTGETAILLQTCYWLGVTAAIFRVL